MDIDWSVFGEAWQKDLAYFREHPVEAVSKVAFFAGVGLVIATVAGPWVAYGLLASGFLYSVYRWFAGVRAAGGDEAKIQQLRVDLAHLIETAIMSGAIIGLRWLRTGGSASAEERLPDVLRPPKSTNVVTTAAAGEMTKALNGPDDALGPKQNALIPATGAGLQRIYDVLASPVPVEGFVPVSPNLFSAIKALNKLSPPERWESLQRMVSHELDTHFVPPVVFRQGKYSRLIVKEWALEFPSEWMDGPIDGQSIAGRLASRVNEILEYWTVALECAHSPTQRAFILREFPGPLVREAEKLYRVVPLPIKDPDRVSTLVAALPAHLDWPVVRERLATARRDYAEPTENPLEGVSLVELEMDADAVKHQMTGYASALGSRSAGRWARQQYHRPSAGQRTATPPVRPRALRHDDFEFDGRFYQRMQLANADWAHPEVDVERRCDWLTTILNEQLANWGVPKWRVVPGHGTNIDVAKRELMIPEEAFRPEVARNFVGVYEILAYQGTKIVQQWKILKYQLRTMPREHHHKLEFPNAIVAAAQKQPMTAVEFSRAKQLHESANAPERMVAIHQLERAYAQVTETQLAVHDALEAVDRADPNFRSDAELKLELAFIEYEQARRYEDDLNTAFSARPEENEALEVMDRTREVVKILSNMRRLGGP